MPVLIYKSATAQNLSLSRGLTITHIFLALSGVQVRRTVRGRFDCVDNVWIVRRTRVD